jgi:small subunit ribosomal protein S6
VKAFELLVLTKPGLGDDGLAAARGRVEGWLAENDAQLEEVVDVGELPLAFEVKKQTRGHYFLFWFRGPGKTPEGLAQRMRVDEDILRHLVVDRHPMALKFLKPAGEERERERSNGKRGKPDYSRREPRE